MASGIRLELLIFHLAVLMQFKRVCDLHVVRTQRQRKWQKKCNRTLSSDLSQQRAILNGFRVAVT